MRRLIGLRDFVHDAIEATTNLVEETHESVARKPIAVLSLVEPLGSAARTVDHSRRLITKLVFGGIRASNRGVQAVSDLGVTLANEVLEPALAPLAPQAARPIGPTRQQARRWVEGAESALNAVAGDFLAARDNGLSIELRLRRAGRTLKLERAALTAALPQASDKLCIFLHGLGCSDSIWSARDSATGAEDGFGVQLERELGYTSLYVRYNTGLHISQNGRALAQLLERLLTEYPVPLAQIVLVGHSMGGLVARSAAHYAQALDLHWLGKLTHVMCIGSPHLGAPLERAGNALSALLRRFDLAGTQVPAKILDARSAGIKDLCFGSVLDDDWLETEPDSFFRKQAKHVPFVSGVAYGYVAARFLATPGHPLGELLGDLLVQVPSASGHHPDPRRRLPFHMGHIVDGVRHLAMTVHPDVYQQLRRFLSEFRGGQERGLVGPFLLPEGEEAGERETA